MGYYIPATGFSGRDLIALSRIEIKVFVSEYNAPEVDLIALSRIEIKIDFYKRATAQDLIALSRIEIRE